MAAGYTSNYGLCQWAAADKVLRTDFNQDNAKVDAALKGMADQIAALVSLESQVRALFALADRVAALEGKVVSGSYVGSGTYGNSSVPNSISFAKRPALVVVAGGTIGLFSGAADSGISTPTNGESGAVNSVSWAGNTLQWFNGRSAYYQHNVLGQTYYYWAVYF